MPDYKFDFDTVADSNGNISTDQEINLPLSVEIKNSSVETTSQCDDRSHQVGGCRHRGQNSRFILLVILC